MNKQDNENTQKINSPVDKEYTEIIKSNVNIDREFIEPDGKPAKIAYYCRQCKAPAKPKRIGKKLSFKCSECDYGPVSFGTEESIKNFYKVK